MSITQHTPGPWMIRGPSCGGSSMDDGGDYAICTDRGVNRTIIAEAFYRTDREEHQPVKANARLIAAAPELLAACKDDVETLKTLLHDIERLAGGKIVAHVKVRIDATIAAIAKAKGGQQ